MISKILEFLLIQKEDPTTQKLPMILNNFLKHKKETGIKSNRLLDTALDNAVNMSKMVSKSVSRYLGFKIKITILKLILYHNLCPKRCKKVMDQALKKQLIKNFNFLII